MFKIFFIKTFSHLNEARSTIQKKVARLQKTGISMPFPTFHITVVFWSLASIPCHWRSVSDGVAACSKDLGLWRPWVPTTNSPLRWVSKIYQKKPGGRKGSQWRLLKLQGWKTWRMFWMKSVPFTSTHRQQYDNIPFTFWVMLYPSCPYPLFLSIWSAEMLWISMKILTLQAGVKSNSSHSLRSLHGSFSKETPTGNSPSGRCQDQN